MKSIEKKEKLGKLLELRQAMENGADWSFLELQERVRAILKNDFEYSTESINSREGEAYEELGYKKFHNRFSYLRAIYRKAVPENVLVEVAHLAEIKKSIFSVDEPVYLVGAWEPLDASDTNTVLTGYEIGYDGKKPITLSEIDEKILDNAKNISYLEDHPYYYICTAKNANANHIWVETVILEVEFREDYE